MNRIRINNDTIPVRTITVSRDDEKHPTVTVSGTKDETITIGLDKLTARQLALVLLDEETASEQTIHTAATPLDRDSAYAEWLAQRRNPGWLSDEESDWLATWEATHEPPPGYNDAWHDIGHEIDLDVEMIGPQATFGVPTCEEYGFGNPAVAGGWVWCVGGITSHNGWHAGKVSELLGLSAFSDAFDVPMPAGAETRLGPFYSPKSPAAIHRAEAYRALALRLLATIVHVSRVAIAANPNAQKIVARQKRAVRQGTRHPPAAWDIYRARRGRQPGPGQDDADSPFGGDPFSNR
jgi:hypothetical protein